jgi:Kef-type K+ transport system membrane component KefB
VAVALIALTAGTELELRAMRPLFRSIAWISLVAVGGTTLLLSLLAYLLRGWLPFMSSMTPSHAVAVALVLGVVMVAQSPAVVVALRKEMDADGPVTRTVLGVVVIADLLVILMFAVVSTFAKSRFGQGASVDRVVPSLVWELLGSMVAGVLVGVILAMFLRAVRGGSALFVLAVCFVVAEAGRRLHLDPLLIALGAGIFIRNVTSAGDRLHEGIEGSSLPVYVIFFAIAGASIELGTLSVVGGPAIVFVLVRAAGLLLGTRIGARISGAPEMVRRWAGLGLLSQAGLALALASLFTKSFPEFGADASALVLAIVAINQIFAPALYQLALVRSGEAGAAARPASGGAPHEPVEPAETT